MIFSALGTLVDPPLAPTVRGLAGPPAAPSDDGTGVYVSRWVDLRLGKQ